MSQTIHVLPDHVANQIAAGEVIQRPASVVKELLENAVDAGATSIEVHVVDAGRTSIQVVDNGAGMSAEDARVCFERHATSKLQTADDLFALATKGFRGEALASIAAIAHVEVTTCQEGAEVGTVLRCHGSEIVGEEPKARPRGRRFTSRTCSTTSQRVGTFSSPTRWRCVMWLTNFSGWRLRTRAFRLC